MKKIMLALAATLALGGAQAQQQPKTGYISLAFGSSNAKVDCPDPIDCNGSDSGPRASMGLNLNAVAALEAIYIHFGNMKEEFGNGLGTLKGSAQGLGVAVALRHQFIPEFGGVLRLGVMRVNEKLSASVPSLGLYEEASEDSTKPYFGFGLEYRFTPTLKGFAAADFARVKDGRYELYSLGVQADF